MLPQVLNKMSHNTNLLIENSYNYNRATSIAAIQLLRCFKDSIDYKLQLQIYRLPILDGDAQGSKVAVKICRVKSQFCCSFVFFFFIEGVKHEMSKLNATGPLKVTIILTYP